MYTAINDYNQHQDKNGTITHLLAFHANDRVDYEYPDQTHKPKKWDQDNIVDRSADHPESLPENTGIDISGDFTGLESEDEQHESNRNGGYCQWRSVNDTECFDTLIPHMCGAPVNFSVRVLLFGDSTMARLYWHLRDRLEMEPDQSTCQFHCRRKVGSRCNNRPLYGFDENTPARTREPQYGREGPVHYGLNKHGCSDCVSQLQCRVQL